MTRILKIYIIESKHQALAAYVWLPENAACVVDLKKKTIYDLHLNIIYVLIILY